MQLTSQSANSITHTNPTRANRLAALGHTLMERLETPLFVTDANGAVL